MKRGQRVGAAAVELPLLLGLIGLGAGAALAALLPVSDGEARLVARTREDLWHAAETLGHQAATRLRNLWRVPPDFERNG